MRSVKRILVVQTAFLGDVILTLPLIQALKDFFAHADIDVVVVPRAAELCRNHPAIHETIVYDKRGRDRGFGGFLRMRRLLHARRYDLAVVPHRSLRSSALCFLSGIPLRIGFRKSVGFPLLTKRVSYRDDIHEIERNLSLLEGIGIREVGKILPRLYPGDRDVMAVNDYFRTEGIPENAEMIAMAPGTIWNTKRWLKERFAELAGMLSEEGYRVLLVGGTEDRTLCDEITGLAGREGMHNAAGMLSLLQSAEAIRRCRLMVSNDSAPMHMAVAVDTPVVAIFGATVPEFGFSPYGPRDTVVETRGLRCRPCSIHGGDRCPIKTFECMVNISAPRVHARIRDVLSRPIDS